MNRKNKKKFKEYKTWDGMKQRCYNPKNHNYHHYGGRGISVCKVWLDDFYQFRSDMGARPSRGHSIDRIDNNGNYSPSNCRWATIKEQNNNKRNTLFIGEYGVSQTIGEWAKTLEVPAERINSRIKRLQMSNHDALFTLKIKGQPNKIDHSEAIRLKNLGWRTGLIAAWLSCSTSSIIRIINVGRGRTELMI